MVRNVAHLLVDMLEGMTVPAGTYPQTVHGFENKHDVKAWRRHIEALTLVRTVEDTLARMSAEGTDVTIFAGIIPNAYAGVGMAQTPWAATSNDVRPACDQTSLNLLTALAMLIDATGHLDIDESERRSLKDVLDEADSLLAAAEDLSPDIRGYLRALIDRARFIVDNVETYGAEAVRSVALELGGALNLQAERAEKHGDAETAKRWKAAAWLFVAGFMGRTSDDAGRALGRAVSDGVKQIGGG